MTDDLAVGRRGPKPGAPSAAERSGGAQDDGSTCPVGRADSPTRRGEAPSGEDARETLQALRLWSLPGVGAVRFRRLVDRFGSPGEALAAPAAAFASIAGGEAASARAEAGRGDGDAHRVAAQCRQLDVRVLAYGGPEYPARLGDLPDPPALLFARGRAGLLAGPCAAVVGSRRATAYGRRTARAIGAALAAQDRCVVSGMALGIDGEAHRGALPGPTVAVLGSGVDVAAPPRHARLHEHILEAGAVVSEHPPGTPAAPGHFPARNRIIAALAQDVVVVEASLRSGALITAEFALDLGREVHAVPGPIDRPTSQGANQLIAEGANVVLDASLGTAAGQPEPKPRDPELRALLAVVPSRPFTLDELSVLADQPIEAVSAAATALQLQGFLVIARDGRFVKTPGRPAGILRERPRARAADRPPMHRRPSATQSAVRHAPPAVRHAPPTVRHAAGCPPCTASHPPRTAEAFPS